MYVDSSPTEDERTRFQDKRDLVLADLRAQLGARVRQMRKRRSWSQRDIERMFGVASGSLSEIERGVGVGGPGLRALVALALAFDLESFEELFGPNPPTSEAFLGLGREVDS